MAKKTKIDTSPLSVTEIILRGEASVIRQALEAREQIDALLQEREAAYQRIADLESQVADIVGEEADFPFPPPPVPIASFEFKKPAPAKKAAAKSPEPAVKASGSAAGAATPVPTPLAAPIEDAAPPSTAKTESENSPQ